MVPYVINQIFVIAIAIALHELGHIIHARKLGYKPKLKIKWWGFLVDFDESRLRFSDSFDNRIWGIILGLIPVTIFGDFTVLIAYLLACSTDLLSLYVLYSYIKKFGNIRTIDRFNLIW